VRIGAKARIGEGEEPGIIGTSFLAFTDAVAKVHGPRVLSAARERMTDDQRAEMDVTTPITWVRATTMTAWVLALAEAARTSAFDLIEECARLATRDSFTTVWRVFIRFTSAEALVSRTPLIYSRTRNTGKLEVETITSSKAKLVLSGWPGVIDSQLHSLAVSIRTILELSGRRSPICRFERTDDGGVFDVRWA
jgi:hypothetical protein